MPMPFSYMPLRHKDHHRPPAQRRHSNVKINDWTKRETRQGWKKMRNLKIATRRKMALIWLLGWRPVPFFVSVLIGFLPPALELLSFINIARRGHFRPSPHHFIGTSWILKKKIHNFWIFTMLLYICCSIFFQKKLVIKTTVLQHSSV